MVDKEGPRSGMKVKTRTATFAIRGTDFHVVQGSTSGATQLSVLRGQVEVTPQKEVATEQPVASVTVGSGQSAVTTPEAQAPKVLETTKQELALIAQETKVEMKPEQIPEAVKTEIKALEEQAKTNVLKDIERHDPKLYAEISKKEGVDLEDINMKTVEKVYQKAPEAKGKPLWRDFDEADQDPYKKYFKKL
jgi:hypothetical protein